MNQIKSIKLCFSKRDKNKELILNKNKNKYYKGIKRKKINWKID